VVKKLSIGVLVILLSVSFVAAFSVSLDYPVAGSNYSVVVEKIDWSLSGINASEVSACWYTLDGGINNVSSSDCSDFSYTTLINSTEGDNNWVIYANDSSGVVESNSVTFFVDSIFPIVSVTSPSDPAALAQTQFTISLDITEANPNSASVRVYDSSWNLLLFEVLSSSGNDNFQYPSAGSVSDGTYYYNITADDGVGHVSVYSGTVTLDNVAPYWSGEKNQSENVYAPGKSYGFNITWNDDLTGIESVWIDFDGVNNSVSGSGADYAFSANDLAAGSYGYIWYGNDSAGNVNSTGLLSYTIDKAQTVCSISGANVTYPGLVNVSASCDNAEASLELYRDGVDVTSENGVGVSLPFGSYVYKVNVSETANYTANSESLTVVVSVGVGDASLYVDNSMNDFIGEFPQENILINASLDAGDGNIDVFLDGVSIYSGAGPFSELRNLSLGYYNISVVYSGNINWSSDSEVIWINVSDTTSPSLTLSSPGNNVPIVFSSNNVTLDVGIVDASAIASCDLVLNGAVNQTNSSVSGGNVNYSLFDLASGQYVWSVSCTDAVGNIGSSGNSSFTILSVLTFPVGTEVTDLSLEGDISAVLNFYVKNQYGIINWTGPLDLSSGKNWADYINLTFNRGDVDSVGASELNSSARVTLLNLTFSNPRVLRDQSVCTDCTEVSYSGGVFVFDVTGFSVYESGETPVSPPAPPVTSSSGGGGSSSSTTKVDCLSIWDCGEWNSCSAGEQSRTCVLKVGITPGQCEVDPDNPPSDVITQSCEDGGGFVPLSGGSEGSEEIEFEDTVEEQGQGFIQTITGAITGFAPSSRFVGVLAFLVAVAVAYAFVVKKRKKSFAEELEKTFGSG